MRLKSWWAAVAASVVAAAMVAWCPSAAGAAVFAFSTGNPDGKMAMATRPDSSGKPEIEAGDDFVLTAQTAITHATFIGLLPKSGSVQSVTLEIYRVFPLDSNTTRTPRVPTRVNSPSDVGFPVSELWPGQATELPDGGAGEFVRRREQRLEWHPPCA